jgi:hypothetical protein
VSIVARHVGEPEFFNGSDAWLVYVFQGVNGVDITYLKDLGQSPVITSPAWCDMGTTENRYHHRLSRTQGA